MTTYHLQSGPMIYTPGILRWAINGYFWKKDRAYLRRVFTEGWGLPDRAVAALLSGKVPYTLEGEKGQEMVVFTYPARRK